MSIIFSVGILALCCLVVWRETRSMVDVAAITANAVSTTSRSDAEEPWQPSVPPIHTCRIENGTVAIPTSAPRFVIIGAQKAGTSSLFRYLLDHPDAVPTRNWSTKNSTEVHFFDNKFPWGERKWFDSDEDFHCHVRRVYVQTQYDYPALLADASNNTNGSNDAGTGRLFSFEKTPRYITDARRLPRLLRQILPWMDRVVVSL